MIPENIIAVVITSVLGLVGIVVGGVLALRGRRREGTPDAWTAADIARAEKFAWQDLYYLVRGGWKNYARRMQEHHGDAAALNDEERAALEAGTPDTKKEKP